MPSTVLEILETVLLGGEQMYGKHLLNYVVFHYQRSLGSSLRMRERRRGHSAEVGVIKVVLRSIRFPNEMHIKGQVTLEPQDRTFIF